jgi:hypothetical protein
MNSHPAAGASGLIVAADATGRILAAVPTGITGSKGSGGPEAVRLVPAPGQTLHEVPLPDGAEGTTILESLGQFHVRVDKGRATLAHR